MYKLQGMVEGRDRIKTIKIFYMERKEREVEDGRQYSGQKKVLKIFGGVGLLHQEGGDVTPVRLHDQPAHI